MGWSWFLLLLAAVAAAPGQEAAEPTAENLRCLLAEDPEVCPSVAPPAVTQLLLNAPPDLREALSTQGLRWSEVMALRALGPALVPLLPIRQLRTLPASAASELIRRRPDAAGLAAALVTSLGRDPQRRRDFLEGISKAPLGARAEETLGRWAADTFSGQYDDSVLLRRAATGLLASLPPAQLSALPDESAASFVFTLRSWREMSGASGGATWRRAPAISRRAWCALALRLGQLPRANDTTGVPWSKELLFALGFLLDGCAPGEVAPLPANASEWPALAHLAPAPLTARAILEVALQHSAPPPLNVSLLLAPRQLAQLSPGDGLRKAWTSTMHAGGGARASANGAPLASARAAALLLVASNAGDANGAGALAWALPPALRRRLRAPSAAALASLDSPRFSRMEAEHLLADARSAQNASGAWLQAHGLLRGLRVSALMDLRAEHLPQPLLLHLLRAFPHDAPAPAALALLQRVRTHLGSEALLNATLSGAGAGVLLAQLTPFELRGASKNLVTVLPRAPAHTLRTLPDRVFWAALDAELGDQLPSPDAASYSPALLGLRCRHLRAAGPAVAAPLLDAFNAQLRAAKRPFPVALRRCALWSLAALVELRANTLGPRRSDKPAISALRPHDAETFGGAVVAGVDADVLGDAPPDAARALLSAAGHLPLEQLIDAAGNVTRARLLAREAARLFVHEDQRIQLRKEKLLQNPTATAASADDDLEGVPLEGEGWLGVEALTRMGALRWLLPADALRRVRPDALRLLLEAPSSHDSKASCADADARAQWATLLVQAFGPVTSWTAGAVGAAGGLLATLPLDQRSAIPSPSWTEAADVLAAAWPFGRRPPEGVASGASLLAQCGEGLLPEDEAAMVEAAKDTARRLMEGARQQLKDAQVPGARPQEIARLHEAQGSDETVPLFQPPPVIVLPVDESAESRRRRKRSSGDELRASLSDGAPTTSQVPITQPLATTVAPQGVQAAIIAQDDDWCGVVALSGPAASLALSVSDIHAATPSQLRACAETLGALELPREVATAFWERASVGASAEDGWAKDAGALLGQAPPRLLGRLPHTMVDVQAALAMHLNTEEMMTVAAEAVWKARPSSDPLSATELAATGAALCAMTEESLARRVGGGDGALAGAAATLGAMPWPGCPRRCLTALARLLAKNDVLGSADRWDAADAQVAGTLAAGLHAPFKSLTADAVSGLSAAAIQCIAAPDFEVITEAQILSLRADAARAVSDAQLQRVRDDLRPTLQAARQGAPPPALGGPSPNASSRVGPYVVLITTAVVAALTALGRTA